MNKNIKNKICEYIIFKPKTEDELIKAFDLFKINYKECINTYGLLKEWDLSEIEPYIYIDFFSHCK